jgi:phenolic acid decarboxylase
MNHVLPFSEWSLTEAYYSKNHNLHKIAKADPHVQGKPIFYENDLQNFYSIRRKIAENLIDYKKHVADVAIKDREWRANAVGKRDEKGSIQWLDTASKTRNLALKIVEDAADFMIKFNKEYDDVKESILGSDHTEVANSILKLQDIYPSALITEAGKLKRMKRMKIDSSFVLNVLKWTESIKRIYDNLEDAGKLLGKTDKQIEGARKQSMAQKSRWGMY